MADLCCDHQLDAEGWEKTARGIEAKATRLLDLFDGPAILLVDCLQPALADLRQAIADGPTGVSHIALVTVARRLLNGWRPMPFSSDEVRWCREGPTEDRPDLIRTWEPISAPERIALAHLEHREGT